MDLDGSTAHTEPVWRDDLLTIAQLKQDAVDDCKRGTHSPSFLASALRSISAQTVQTLLCRLATVDHPLTAWAPHAELDRRDVPPCLRPRTPEHSRQHVFIATLADLLWIAKRHPHHAPRYQRMRGVFSYEPQSDEWHRAALWSYRLAKALPSLLADRLALTKDQRRHAFTMATRRQHEVRRTLRTKLPAIREAILEHALNHPDKAGHTTADEIANRRTDYASIFVRLGRKPAETVHYLQTMLGHSVSRQTLVRHLEAAAQAADARTLIFGRL